MSVCVSICKFFTVSPAFFRGLRPKIGISTHILNPIGVVHSTASNKTTNPGGVLDRIYRIDTFTTEAPGTWRGTSLFVHLFFWGRTLLFVGRHRQIIVFLWDLCAHARDILKALSAFGSWGEIRQDLPYRHFHHWGTGYMERNLTFRPSLFLRQNPIICR